MLQCVVLMFTTTLWASKAASLPTAPLLVTAAEARVQSGAQNCVFTACVCKAVTAAVLVRVAGDGAAEWLGTVLPSASVRGDCWSKNSTIKLESAAL